METGNTETGGLGPPNPSQNENARLVRNPKIAPFSFAVSVSIPREKSPSIGPPTMPKIESAASRIPLTKPARVATAKHAIPIVSAKHLLIIDVDLGDNSIALKHRKVN